MPRPREWRESRAPAYAKQSAPPALPAHSDPDAASALPSDMESRTPPPIPQEPRRPHPQVHRRDRARLSFALPEMPLRSYRDTSVETVRLLASLPSHASAPESHGRTYAAVPPDPSQDDPSKQTRRRKSQSSRSRPLPAR